MEHSASKLEATINQINSANEVKISNLKDEKRKLMTELEIWKSIANESRENLQLLRRTEKELEELKEKLKDERIKFERSWEIRAKGLQYEVD